MASVVRPSACRNRAEGCRPSRTLATRTQTLDLPEEQVLVEVFRNQAGVNWYHLLLLLPTPTPGVWIASTPDLTVQSLDLSGRHVIVLPRAGDFPAHLYESCYIFDKPVPYGACRDIRQRAADLSRAFHVVAAVPQDTYGGAWLIADPDAPGFGKEVRTVVVADLDEGCADEAHENGFAFVDDRWRWCQCVAPVDFEDWIRNLISATARERRSVGVDHDPVIDSRFHCLFDAIRRFSKLRTPLLGLAGQRLSRGYVRALRAAGMEWMRHYLDLAHESGLLPRSWKSLGGQVSAGEAQESLGAMPWTLSGPKTKTRGTGMIMILIAVVIIIIFRSHVGSSLRIVVRGD